MRPAGRNPTQAVNINKQTHNVAVGAVTQRSVLWSERSNGTRRTHLRNSLSKVSSRTKLDEHRASAVAISSSRLRTRHTFGCVDTSPTCWESAAVALESTQDAKADPVHKKRVTHGQIQFWRGSATKCASNSAIGARVCIPARTLAHAHLVFQPHVEGAKVGVGAAVDLQRGKKERQTQKH